MNMFAKSRVCRGVRSPVWVSGLDQCEDRPLLSGVAVYPQPAFISIERVEASVAPPIDFSGYWNIDSTEGAGVAFIKYRYRDGNEVLVNLMFYGTTVGVEGKVKGDTVKLKVNQTIEGFDVKGKIKATLDNPTEMSGTAKAKVAGLGKFTVPFTGTKVT